LLAVLGDDALDLELLAEKRYRSAEDLSPPMGLSDFFFDDDDPLRPGEEDDESI